MMSNFDNCILLNAILKNDNLYDDSDASYLFMLQGLHQQIVMEYYSRSEKIILKMRELGVDNMESWSEIDNLYVNDIVDEIKIENYNGIIPKIRNLIETLETKYGVE